MEQVLLYWRLYRGYKRPKDAGVGALLTRLALLSVASISLPEISDVYGWVDVLYNLPAFSDLCLSISLGDRLWPAFWLMGNLARPGYGGRTDGMWPYSYDTCDIGTLPNQTLNGKLDSVVARFINVILERSIASRHRQT